MKITPRICIYPKDVMKITGKSERYSRKLLVKIKAACSKQNHHYVTIDDFCLYTGLKIEQVQPYL